MRSPKQRRGSEEREPRTGNGTCFERIWPKFKYFGPTTCVSVRLGLLHGCSRLFWGIPTVEGKVMSKGGMGPLMKRASAIV